MLGGPGPLVTFFRNRDDFRNKSNIRIPVKRDRLGRIRIGGDCSRLPEGRAAHTSEPTNAEAPILTFNVELVELVNGDLEVAVKVVEVQKDVQDVVVVVAVDPPVGAADRLGVRRRRKRAR